MVYKIGITILITALLAACVPAATAIPPTAAPVMPAQPTAAAPTPYVGPAESKDASQGKNMSIYPSPLDPLPNESSMVKGQAFVDTSEIVASQTTPGQYDLSVEGNLPTPCNSLKATLSGPDDQNRIQVELYSLAPADRMCAQMLKPFETLIPLGSLKSGKYTVLLNSSQVGEISVP